MSKEKVKEKVLKEGKETYLSAQEYARMSTEDKKAIREVLKDEGKDADEYEEQMRKLWPKPFTPKSLTWRKSGSR